MTKPVSTAFADLGLADSIVRAVNELGYEQPSPIQAQSIPTLLQGQDLLGQAQTGTGKTAAFALPLLGRLDAKHKQPQLLVLTPTRELAIQVAEACQQYAKYCKKIDVLPIYGGQSYTIQLKQLGRGVQVVVGTPGRIMDHIRRGTLKLDGLKSIVLDEADEMLRMGFIDDVEWILEQAPEQRQIALFSATMPRQIKKVADRYLSEPAHIQIESKTTTATNIRQRYWIVRGTHKLDAITRILESEETDGVIVFVRTKNATVELADKLQARGFRSEALNGDIAQAVREKVVDRLRKAKLDILVATDVVARGLDVERISHVINYDVPHDTESYVHRIGRTGRAGRSGEAILFVAPREKRMLRAIEHATKQEITAMALPSIDAINEGRQARFKASVLTVLQNENLDVFSQLIAQMQSEQEISAEQIAAAACFLAQGGKELLLKADAFENQKGESLAFGTETGRRRKDKPAPAFKATPLKDFPDVEMGRFLIHIGRQHQVKPANLVGCIANEADLESKYIGEIEIRNHYSTVDLPADMPKEILAILKRARVSGRPLKIERYHKVPEAFDTDSRPSVGERDPGRPKNPKKHKKRSPDGAKNKAKHRPKNRKSKAKPKAKSKSKPKS